MNLLTRLLLAGLLVTGLGGCTSMLDSNNDISIRESSRPAAAHYPVTLRVASYVDARNAGDARLVGKAYGRVVGMSGSEIRLDRDAAEVVRACMSARMEEAGFGVLAQDDAAAMFELGGEVREMRYEVKDRDYVSITVATTLTDVASGKLLWSGEVVQKGDRFAGVSGNNRQDIAHYLHGQLEEVSGKTADAILAALKSSRSTLFAQKAAIVPGVTVFVNSGKDSDVATTPSPTAPAASNGLLTVRSEPGRAKVYVDGVYHGMTPLSVEASPGIHKVEVKMKEYRTVSEKVSVRRGDTTELEVALEK